MRTGPFSLSRLKMCEHSTSLCRVLEKIEIIENSMRTLKRYVMRNTGIKMAITNSVAFRRKCEYREIPLIPSIGKLYIHDPRHALSNCSSEQCQRIISQQETPRRSCPNPQLHKRIRNSTSTYPSVAMLPTLWKQVAISGRIKTRAKGRDSLKSRNWLQSLNPFR